MSKVVSMVSLVASLFGTAGSSFAQSAKPPANKSQNQQKAAPNADLRGTWGLHIHGVKQGTIVMDDMQLELKLTQSGAVIKGTATGDLAVNGWVNGIKITIKQKMATSDGSALYIVYAGKVTKAGAMQGTATYPGHKSVTWDAARTAGQKGRAIVLPDAKGDQSDALNALKAIAPTYENYSVTNVRVPITTAELSLGVTNIMDYFWGQFDQGGQRGVSKQSLDSAEQHKVTDTIQQSINSLLTRSFRVSDSARYRLIVQIHGINGVSRMMGRMGARIFFLDTKERQMIWYTDELYGAGIDPSDATISTLESIKRCLAPFS